MAYRISRSHCLMFVLSICFTGAFRPSITTAATWTDVRGEHTIEADLVGVWGDQVILRKSDGTRISITLTNLRTESRIQAEKLNGVLVQQRTARIAELKKIAAEADAPAPKNPPVPAPAAAYNAPTAEMAPDVFMQHVNSQAQAGHHLVVYYDALPPTYRADIDELFTMATSKLDPTNWASLTNTLKSFGELVVTRQKWIFSHPRFMAASDSSGKKLEDGVLALTGALYEGFKPENVALEKLQSMKLRDYLAIQDQVLAPYLAQLAQLNDTPPQIIVDSTKQDVAILSISQGAQTQKVSLTKVEGFWIPTDYATKWQANMTTAKAELAAKANGEVLSGGVASMVVSTIDAMITPLRAAKDATQFHLAMESVFSVAQPMVSMIAVAAGGLKGGAGNNGYGNEYGMEGMDGMDGMNVYDPAVDGFGGPGGNGSMNSGGSSGPPTNAMEAARRTSEAASRGGPAGN